MDYVSVQIVERVKQIYLWVCLLLFYDNSRHKMYNAALRIPDLFFFLSFALIGFYIWFRHPGYGIYAQSVIQLIKLDLTFHT